MKKVLILVLGLVLALSLAACNEKSEEISVVETQGVMEADNIVEAGATVEETAAIDETIPQDTQKELPAIHIHDFAAEITAPTCTEEGYTTYTCSCGESYVGDPVQAIGHTFGQWETTKQPTEAATGTAQRVCSVCNEKEGKTLGKLVANHTHSYTSKVQQVATCTTHGRTLFSCACGDSYYEWTSTTEHNYTAKVTEPTCEVYGYITYYCTCGKSYQGDIISPQGHTGTYTIVKEPSCSEKGIERYACPCGFTLDLDIYEEPHTWEVTESVKSTCVVTGYNVWTCKVCGFSYTSYDSGPYSQGHTYEFIEVKPATCTEKSLIEKTCIDCHYVDDTTYTAMLGHLYTFNADTCEKEQACQRCGEVAYFGHTWRGIKPVCYAQCAYCGIYRYEIYGHQWGGDIYCAAMDCPVYDEVAMAKAHEIVDNILAENHTEYDIVKAIHDYIVNNTVYDYDNYLNGTILCTSYGPRGVLLHGIAVCSGYADTFELLCDLAGIECVVIGGWSTRTGEGHAWNQVRVDGVWYNVDVCWDDPVSSKPILRYNYFLISDEEFYTTHGTHNKKYDCLVSYPGSHT